MCGVDSRKKYMSVKSKDEDICHQFPWFGPQSGLSQMVWCMHMCVCASACCRSVLAMLSDNARTMGPLRQKLQYVEVWLHRRHLSDRLARCIRAYYTEIWAAHKGQLDIT